MKRLTRQISDRVRHTDGRVRTRWMSDETLERREHNRAIADPRIRDEHYAGRARDVAAGGRDCPYCA